jgi:LacI family transcriptional regulator
MNSSSRPKEATVSDVAKAAKVSKAQAARALGDYGSVSAEVRERVRQAAADLGYHPNALARSMNTGRSNTIGVLVGDIENPYFSLATRGISDTAKSRGYDVILANTGEDVKAEIDAVQILMDKRVDGLIVSPTSARETNHLEAAAKTGRPIVLLDRRLPGLGLDTVEVNMEELSHRATEDLIRAGHRAVGFISTLDIGGQEYVTGMPLDLSSVADRVSGILSAFSDADLEFDSRWIRLNAGGAADIAAKTRQLLDMPNAPTAIVASDSVVGLSVLLALREFGLTIPEDLSFMMFDDLPWTSLISPPVSVISQPAHEIGVQAAQTLIARLSGIPVSQGHRVLEGRVIQRQSVAAPKRSTTEPLSIS